jgi:hypothetical protein
MKKSHERLHQANCANAEFQGEHVHQLESVDEASTVVGHVAKLLQELGLDDIEK